MNVKFSKTLILPVKVLHIKNNNIAFTMAETLVVVSALGIIAALTIPGLYSRHTQSLNRTKIKKAMAVYETAVRRMVSENKLGTEVKFDRFAASDNNCENTTRYFIKEEGSGCQFKTTDDVWWDITNMRKPIIAFSRRALNDASANEADYRNSFYLIMSYDNNNRARINDIGYENANATENSMLLSSLYDFVNNTDKYSNMIADNQINQNKGNLENTENIDNTDFMDNNTSGSVGGVDNNNITQEEEYNFDNEFNKLKNNEFNNNCENPNIVNDECTNCKACVIRNELSYSVTYYDSKGNMIAQDWGCALSAPLYYTVYDSSGNKINTYNASDWSVYVPPRIEKPTLCTNPTENAR